MKNKPERAVTDPAELVRILETCKVLRLGLYDEDGVYIVPLNYGYAFENGALTFYFHGATQGRKLDILRKNNLVGFELDCDHALKSAAGPCGHSYYYSSIIGTGQVTILEDLDEKADGLNRILAHQAPEAKQAPRQAAVLVSVFRLDVKQFTAKQHHP